MPYRDPVDPQTAELEALIASEPALRDALQPVLHEHAELTARAEVLGSQLAAAEVALDEQQEGGVIASLRSVLGASLEERRAEVAQLSKEHADVTAQCLELANREQTLRAKLATITRARVELASLGESRIAALRVEDGLRGDEVRALDEADLRDQAQHVAILNMLDLVDFAYTAVWQFDTILQDLAQVTGVGSSINATLERFESPFTTPQTVADRVATRQRLDDAIGYARTRVHELLARYEETGCAWFATTSPTDIYALVSTPVSDPVEHTAMVVSHVAITDCFAELSKGLLGAADKLTGHLAGRAARRREMVGVR